uniref:Clusterin n=1 Tax=Anabas testudineus TaxID=64144 RepID=A0A7N6FGV5_ANATE
MRGLLVQILCMSLLDALCSAADSPTLNLSAVGEQYVDMEIKQALLGVKQMKGMMGRKEEKHKHLMDALRYSRDKTKLVKETQLKLDEAEQQCRDLTEASFTECRPCLEDTCKAFYTSMCRRGFASFSFKGNSESLNQQDEGKADLEVLQAEASFSQLQSNISLLYNQSLILVKKMQQVFGHSFLVAFTAELQPSSLSAVQDGSNADLLRTVDHILDSVSDFGKNVLEELSSTVADQRYGIEFVTHIYMGSLSALGQSQDKYVCRRLRRQASECWQLQDLCETCKDYLLKECPSVQQLHSEMEEMYMLLNASRQQYDDRLQLVQRHTADTQGWLNSMDDKYGWVSQLSSNTVNPLNIFNVIRLNDQHQMKEIRPKPDSSVVVTVLNAAPLTVLVPADLDVNDPAFIQYAAREALTIHKRTIRGNGSVALVA